jgi:multidrug resistance efflux pump
LYTACAVLGAAALLAACTLPFGGQTQEQGRQGQRRAARQTSIAAGTPRAALGEDTSGRGQVLQEQIGSGGTPVLPERATALPTRAVQAEGSVTVDGSLAASAPGVTVGFKAAGRVTAVRVSAGQAVKRGEVMAELDATTLRESLALAEERLTLQRANIDNSLRPASETDLKSAQASLSSAYAAYNELKKGSKSNGVEQALRSLNQSKNSLYQTQLSRDLVCRIVPGVSTDEYVARVKHINRECRDADLNVEVAELRLRNAEQNYRDSQKPATQVDLSRAWSNVVQAQANVAKLKRGVSVEQKAVYAIQLKQAEVAVARAQRALKDAQLLSPCDCVVQTVTLSVGALASGGGVALLDTSALQFRTSNLSERDVVALSSGQRVIVRLKAFDQTIDGNVAAILPQSSGQLSGAALYTALIALDANELNLLPGMTGQAEIDVAASK